MNRRCLRVGKEFLALVDYKARLHCQGGRGFTPCSFWCRVATMSCAAFEESDRSVARVQERAAPKCRRPCAILRDATSGAAPHKRLVRALHGSARQFVLLEGDH